MFQKMKIFEAVVQKMSFTDAAQELGLSQSAVSQSVAALERELGTRLIERTSRRIALTPAGRRFSDGAAEILASLEQLRLEMRTGHWTNNAHLKIAYSNLFRGNELEQALIAFSMRHPETAVDVAALSHETIYEQLLSGHLDLALSDQRRAFSSDFENIPLAQTPVYAELSSRHPLANRKRLNISELQTMSCILIVPDSDKQREAESRYYAALLGFKGNFLFTDSLDAARLMTSSGRSFLLAQGRWSALAAAQTFDGAARLATVCIPLFKSGHLIKEHFCAFLLKSRATALSRAFVRTLKTAFAKPQATPEV